MKEMNKKFHWIKGDEVRFLIPDMGVPKDAEEFRRMVEWVKKQLAKKAKIHAGCIGGHGRTGTFLARSSASSASRTRSNTCARITATRRSRARRRPSS